MDRAGTGRRGEAAAARFYEKQGAALVTRQLSHPGMGEIDLILREPDGTLVFCEVKTRAKDSLDTPGCGGQRRQAAPYHRIRRMVLSKAPDQSDEPVRFDVAEVVPLDSGRWMGTYYKGRFSHVKQRPPVGKCTGRGLLCHSRRACFARSTAKKERQQCSFLVPETKTAK